jgi:hypothetical protein
MLAPIKVKIYRTNHLKRKSKKFICFRDRDDKSLCFNNRHIVIFKGVSKIDFRIFVHRYLSPYLKIGIKFKTEFI